MDSGATAQQRSATSDKGGTMRLGAFEAVLAEDSQVARIYGQERISERHRHRYEVNITYRERLERAGLRFSGMSPDKKLPEIIEIPGHPWFIGVQFHPELKSRPVRPASAVRVFCGRRRDPKQARLGWPSTPNSIVEVRGVRIGNALPLALFAGPCQLESRPHALEMASALKEIAARLGIGLVYKTSFDKANRTSARSARGIGLKAALPIFAEIRETLGLPVLTDVHDASQCALVAEAVDVLQIPAFLCRQTDLLNRGCRNRARGKDQERPVPRALGHEKRGRQGACRRQPQCDRHRARRQLRL